MKMRPGEVLIDKLESIEDTKVSLNFVQSSLMFFGVFLKRFIFISGYSQVLSLTSQFHNLLKMLYFYQVKQECRPRENFNNKEWQTDSTLKCQYQNILIRFFLKGGIRIRFFSKFGSATLVPTWISISTIVKILIFCFVEIGTTLIFTDFCYPNTSCKFFYYA